MSLERRLRIRRHQPYIRLAVIARGERLEASARIANISSQKRRLSTSMVTFCSSTGYELLGQIAKRAWRYAIRATN
jgi:hypothetical protein